MRLFLCEKPSQGRDIAKILAATKRGDGCLIGQDVIVTWCVGHLLETAPPEHYNVNYKKWVLEHLPIVPTQWEMVVKRKTNAQFKVVKKLLGQATELIIATDADREGEMIARELIEFCAYRGKISRLWLSALNDASIRKALTELRTDSETISMYYSALTRSRSDWLIGMNMSRLFTLLAQQSGYSGVLSVGRVQTPTLSLVVKRDRDIANFEPKPYWTVEAELSSSGKCFIASWLPSSAVIDNVGRCIVAAEAKSASNNIQQARKATVTNVQTERIKEVPPLLFDLGTLQQVCSSKFGLGAQETLDTAQALYEKHKATTYPRTDCGYLPESMYPDAPSILNAIVRADPNVKVAISKLDITIKSRVWNDNKITAHHAIIPTAEVVDLSALTENELNVYQLIRSYYLAQFLPHHEYDRTIAEFICNGFILKATGKQIVISGWRSIFKDDKNDDNDEDQAGMVQVLPDLRENIDCEVRHVELKTLKTIAPKPYTEGELIKSMKGIAKFVTDPRLKQKLKETTGIGTEATRASIIKGLLDRHYLIKKGRAVKATEAAFILIDTVPPAIIDPGMTALWEQALENIERGDMTMENFLSKQGIWISQIIAQYSKRTFNIKAMPVKLCPSCNAPMIMRKGTKGQFFACSRYPDCKTTENIKKAK